MEELVALFYERAKSDPEIGHFFSESMGINWEHHLPVMQAFWKNALFHAGGYLGNMMETHRNVHAKNSMTPAHFDRWVAIFAQSVDDLFEGELALRAKRHAYTMATLLQIKLL